MAEKEICGTFWADETSVNLSDTSGFTHKKTPIFDCCGAFSWAKMSKNDGVVSSSFMRVLWLKCTLHHLK